MNGLVVVNKEAGKTSRDVVNELNHIFSTKKIGHTGTLDPIATGVLVCLIGKYTKLVDLITSYDKEYIATIKLGVKTDTGDITGHILEENNPAVTLSEVEEMLLNFPKTYDQEVPIYSAVKNQKKKLYEYARENISVSLPKRKVNIYNLELISFKDNLITFKAQVSKGTYIRSLIQDICTKLHTIGTMSSLIRTKQGKFDIKDSYTLNDIKNNNYKLLDLQDFLDYPIISLPDTLIKKVSNGGVIPNTFNIQDKVIFTYQDSYIAIYEVKEKELKPYIML